MNPELPKSIRSALASQGAAGAHPPADLLTAFAEHTLSQGENERIADHLARCEECREVVFLGSSTDERCVPQHRRAAVQAPLRSRSRWLPRMTWLVSGGAAIAIVAGILVQQYLAHDRSNQKNAQVAQVAAQQPPTASQTGTPSASVIAPEAKKTVPEPKAKPSRSGNLPRGSSDTLAQRLAPATEAGSPDVANIPLTSAASQLPGIVAGGSANSFEAAVPTQNTFAEGQEGSQAHGFTPSRMPAAPRALVRQPSAAKTWRVTPEGHLEHFTPTGWTGVLTDQTAKFRVVSESRSGIWAGGSRGELFHSADGGENWSEIALPAPPDAKNDPIVTIHFADLQHGMVVTENGLRYSTSDGGKNWTRE